LRAGGELLAEFVLAMKHGLGLGKILGTIHAYPTMAEANKYAAASGGEKSAERLLKLVEHYHRWRRGERVVTAGRRGSSFSPRRRCRARPRRGSSRCLARGAARLAQRMLPIR
jgi:hypothetical protein